MSIDGARYINLATFRKTGVRVETPVWFASDSQFHYALSNNQAGKVKRLRNSSRCSIAPCTVLGNPVGPWQDSQAFLIETPEEQRYAHNLLRKKYGLQMMLLDSGAWIGGRIKDRTYIRIVKNET